VNILFINSIQMFGGGEVWLLSTMRGLSKRGHKVALICRPGTPLEGKAREEGLPVFPIKMRGDFDPIVIYKTARVIKKLRAEVVCTNMDKELRFGGLAARLCGVKAVVPRRGIDYPLKNKWRYRFSYNCLASRIIANSYATKKTLLREAPWLDPDRVEVIYNGIDTTLFDSKPGKDIRDELKIDRKAPLIGFVGQLDERKGIIYLLEAFKSVSKQIPKAKLLLVGEGNLKGFIQNWVGENGLTEKVILTGFREDIPDVMRSIDLLALPSLWEGFGIVLIEAMASGKPVVATRTSNIPEVVRDGKTGLLVKPRDSEELAGAIIKLLEEEDLAEEMGRRGREWVKERFTLERMLDQLENLFYELVK